MTTVYALVILMTAGMDGGRAINTDLRFSGRASCEAAITEIMRAASGWKPMLSCVEVRG